MVLKDSIDSAPFPMALIEMEILEVLDQSWIGVSVNSMGYEWAPDERDEMDEVVQDVYLEMREWQG